MNLITYEFNKNQFLHYIEIDAELTANELTILTELLAVFPHCNNPKPERYQQFMNLAVNTYDKKLLFLAANAFDRNHNTVLGVACEYGKNIAAIQRLIDLGAALDVPDRNQHKLALHWAICNKFSYCRTESYAAVAAVRCLLNNGANPNIRCYDNMTVLQYAERRSYPAALTLLQNYNNQYARGIMQGILSLFSIKLLFDNNDIDLAFMVFLTQADLKTLQYVNRTVWLSAKITSYLSDQRFKQFITTNSENKEKGYSRVRKWPDPEFDQHVTACQTVIDHRSSEEIIDKQLQKSLAFTRLSVPNGFFYQHRVDKIGLIPGLTRCLIPSYHRCLNTAVALFLRMDKTRFISYLADLLEQRGEEFFATLVDLQHSAYSLSGFLQSFRRHNGYGSDRLTIDDLMLILQRPIITINFQGEATNKSVAQQFPGEPIFIGINSKMHHDAFHLDDGYTPTEILATLPEANTDVNLVVR